MNDRPMQAGTPAVHELFDALQKVNRLEQELAHITLALAQIDESLRHVTQGIEAARRRIGALL
jgi:hypothetical protein